MKRLIAILLSILCVLQIPVSATRRRHTEVPISNGTSAEPAEKDYGSIRFFDIPDSSTTESLFDTFKINGKKIIKPDVAKYTNFDKSSITNFSDALVDYLGWDFAIGDMNLAIKENKVSITKLQDGPICGYSRRKFGSEDIKFKIKIDDKQESWFGVAIRCDSTQKVQWDGNTGYLIIIKNDRIELQKYFPSFFMAAEALNIKPIPLGEWHEVSVNSVKEEKGTRITVSVDGIEHINWLDEQENAPNEEGYVNIISYFDNIEIMPVDTPTIKHKNPDDNENALDISNVIAVDTNSSEYFNNGAFELFDKNDDNVAPIEMGGETYVPLRLVERLGAWVDWNNEYQYAQIEYGKNKYILAENFKEITVNGVTQKLRFAPGRKNGRIYVPVDFICNYFNCKKLSVGNVSFIYFNRSEPSEKEKEMILQGFAKVENK